MPIYNLSSSLDEKQNATGNFTTSTLSVNTSSGTVVDLSASSYGGLFSIYNASTTNTIYVNTGTTVSTSNYRFLLPPQFMYENETPYRGAVTAVTASGTASVQVSSAAIILI